MQEVATALGRILVVDDELDVRKSIGFILAKAGFDVIEAEDGEKAITAIRSDDNPRMVDTIICDLSIPKVNGIDDLILPGTVPLSSRDRADGQAVSADGSGDV